MGNILCVKKRVRVKQSSDFLLTGRLNDVFMELNAPNACKVIPWSITDLEAVRQNSAGYKLS